MSNAEQERVKRIMEHSMLGDIAGKRFVWDDITKMIRPSDYADPDKPSLPVTESDMGHAVSGRRLRG